MHVYIYTHAPRGPGETPAELERDIMARLVYYLRDENGRKNIALWKTIVHNTAWDGQHVGLYPGVTIQYRFNMN